MTDFATLVLGADTTGLVRAEAALDSITGKAGRAQKAATGFNQGMGQASQASQYFSKSAKDSASAFASFDTARDQVNKLTASFDPSVAAALKLSNAVDQLDNALETGVISQREYDSALIGISNKLMGVETSVESATTSMQSQINTITQVTSANTKLASSSAEVFEAQNKLEASVDQLRRSYDQVYANSKRYESAVQTLDAALEAGVISGQQHAQMLQSAGASMLAVDNRAAKLSRTMGGVQGNIGNMTAQLNDIGTMMAAGQSPLLLAFQQGTQVSQAFDSMGDAAVTSRQRIAVMGSAFKQALSPANLLILAIIGGVAAATQFGMKLLGMSDDAKTAEDAVDDLASAIRRVSEFTELAQASQQELAREFGASADEARRYARVLAEMARIEAIQAQVKAVQALSEDFEGLKENVDALRNAQEGTSNALSGSVLSQWIRNIREDFGVTEVQANRLRDAVEEIELATTATGRNDALQNLLDVMTRTRDISGEVPDQLLPIISVLGDAVLEGMKLEASIDGSNGPARELFDNLGSVEGVIGNIVGRFNQFRQSMADFSIPFQDAMGELDFELSTAGMNAADKLVATRVRRLEEEMRSATEEAFGADVGLTPRQQQQLEDYEEALRSAAPALTATSSAASTARETLEELTRAQGRAQDAIEGVRDDAVTYNQVVAELDSLLDRGKISMGEYAQAVERVRDSFESTKGKASEFVKIQRSAEDAIVDFATGGEDALDNLSKSFQRLIAQAALFGQGPFGELLGGSSGNGILGGLTGAVTSAISGGASASSSPLDGQMLFDIAGSFEGGGYTGSGPRSGGLDGRGGRLYMLHPNERVFDETRGQPASDGGVINNITVVTPPGMEAQEDTQANPSGGEDITITLDRAVSGLVRDPSSNLSRVLGSGFGLNRTRRSR